MVIPPFHRGQHIKDRGYARCQEKPRGHSTFTEGNKKFGINPPLAIHLVLDPKVFLEREKPLEPSYFLKSVLTFILLLFLHSKSHSLRIEN